MEVSAIGAMQMMNSNRCGTTMETRWGKRKDYGEKLPSTIKSKIPIYISTNPSQINLQDLSHLYSTCNHSCHRFPKLDHMGQLVEPVDAKKLAIAISNSSVLVSVFCNSRDVVFDGDESDDEGNEREPSREEANPFVGLGDLFQKMMPLPLHLVSPSNGQLVGFGRAVSDFGLTASIYDVMVIPSLQGMGIGKLIVRRIVRMLTSRDIYDISALCSAKQRLFFKACGFGLDSMGATTMMYARAASTISEGDQVVKSAGRKLLLVPPFRSPLRISEDR